MTPGTVHVAQLAGPGNRPDRTGPGPTDPVHSRYRPAVHNHTAKTKPTPRNRAPRSSNLAQAREAIAWRVGGDLRTAMAEGFRSYLAMKTDPAAAAASQALIDSDLRELGIAARKLANHAFVLGGELGFGTAFLKWLAFLAAA
jgi:hypothetical protein